MTEMRLDPPVVTEIERFRSACDEVRKAGRRVALVPTMGALHEGHLSLVDRAKQEGGFVAVSVFVNPAQFGPGEDLDRYPRDLDGDRRKLSGRNVNLVFAPKASDMYGKKSCTEIRVTGLTNGLCGAHRPGHFEGVALIVAKLFNITGPCAAVFGRKDFQQLKVIERMARDLDMPVEVVGAPTVRERDGLAMSSRNVYLSEEARERALSICSGLAAAHNLFDKGERHSGELRRAAASPVEKAADSVDYVTAADPETLVPIDDDADCGDQLLIAVAAKFGKTRLIDNSVMGEDTIPISA